MSTTLEASAVDFTRLVEPGDTVVWTQGAGEPLDLIATLLEQRHEIGHFRVFLAGSYAGAVRPEHVDAVEVYGLGGVGTNRSLCDAGAMEVIPCHLSDLPNLIRHGSLRPQVVLTQLSEADATGELSFGAVNGYIGAAMGGARVVVAEVNRNAPWTHARAAIDRRAIDLAIHSSRPLIEVPAAEPSETDRAIAAEVARFIEDGSTVQIGIGAVPRAVLAEIADRRDLGIHSGVIGDAVVDLIETGAITNARKAIDAGRSIVGALVGTKRLYDFAHEHAGLLVEPIEYTHDHQVLRRLDGLVAINSALEVDLTGQVGSEVAGSVYVGTVGGLVDFVRGAMAAARGRSVIGLPSRTRRGASRVVCSLRGPVTASRADADVFVTEFGTAELRGQPLNERVRRMIAIAHPEDRDRLELEARENLVGVGG